MKAPQDWRYTIAYMLAIAAAFTALVSGLQIATAGITARNHDVARKRVVLAVLGVEVPEDATPARVLGLYEQNVTDTGLLYEVDGEERPILSRQGADGKAAAYAFEVAGMGLWDVIRGYVAVSADLGEIVRIAFYQQNETPGLGAEVAKPAFIDQFTGKRLTSDTSPGEPLVRLSPPGSELGPNEVDAITGATLTSRGVETFLNADLRAFLEAMRRNDPEAEGRAEQ
jgi:Na+-transporting NADH:ubiquinone oxidoreductase subunit C